MTAHIPALLRLAAALMILSGLICSQAVAADAVPSCCASAPMTVRVTHVVTQGNRLSTSATHTVTTVDYQFTLQTITIAPGDIVTWSNNSGTTHTSTSDTGVWDSGNILTGTSFSRTFPTAGTFPYHCFYHQNIGMVGTIVVATPPVITSSLAVSGSIGVPFAYSIIAAGATSFGATGLPPGLTINTSTGTITGTPTALGVSTSVAPQPSMPPAPARRP